MDLGQQLQCLSKGGLGAYQYYVKAKTIEAHLIDVEERVSKKIYCSCSW